ncbi:MAG: hypothetical protein PVG14_12175 [Anaerolineales bacterium]
MVYSKVKEYLEDGVKITFDDQHKGVFVERKDLYKPPNTRVFTLIREVVNIGFFKKSRPNVYEKSITPAIKLRVKYKQADMNEAKSRGQPLKLAWWNGKDWVIFTCKKSYSNSQNWSGHFDTEISDWGDPPIAWGT